MTNSLISIIVPVYNVEKYLPKCLNSIINQTYKNIEIILIDDGSTDKSSCICDEYRLKDDRIKVIHQSNRGVSFARRVGFIKSKGNMIIFIDSDDYISEMMIEVMYNTMISENADIVICKDVNVNNGKNNIRKWPDKNCILKREDALKYIACDKLKSFFCNKMFKKKIVNENDFILNVRFEDFLCMPQIFNRIEKSVAIIEPLYFYVRHQESFTYSNKNPMKFFEACIERNNWYKKYCPKFYNLSIKRTIEVAISCLNYEMSVYDKQEVEKFLFDNINLKKWLIEIKFKEKIKLFKYLFKRGIK